MFVFSSYCLRLLAVSICMLTIQLEAIAQTLPYPSDAITFAQKSHEANGNVFVLQKELDILIAKAGGGACPSAAAIDLLQVLLGMTGDKLIANPHKVALEAFTHEPRLLNGRVPNELFEKLIKYYDQQHLLDSNLKISIKSSPGYSAYDQKWRRHRGPKLHTDKHQLKILSYTVTEAKGNELGRHFVLLKERKENLLTVLDPSNPTKDYRYEVKFDDDKQFRRIYLNRPSTGNPNGLIYELNTVFTVTVDETKKGYQDAPSHPKSVERVNAKIDETARELWGENKTPSDRFTSPVLWRQETADFGLPGLDMPIEFGGAGWNAEQTLEVFRHAGSHNLNFRDIVGGAHGRLLTNSTNPEVAKIIKEVINGDAYIAVAMTEPTAGSDFHAIKSFAKKTEGGFLLTGEKRYVARLKEAKYVVLFAKATSGQNRELSAFVIPLDTPGLEVIELNAHGLKGNSFGGLKFKDLFVSDSQLIGEDGKGADIFEKHFRYWRLMQAAAALGTGEGALKQMAERISTRNAFGGPIGRFTHLQQPLGQYTTELEMAASLAREAARLLDLGGKENLDRAELLINGLKAEGVEISLAAVDAATRAFGAEGYSTQVDLGDRLQDLNGLRIADGTTDVMRMSVVSKRFGREFWDMAVRSNTKNKE